jgi:hypothetical protein
MSKIQLGFTFTQHRLEAINYYLLLCYYWLLLVSNNLKFKNIPLLYGVSVKTRWIYQRNQSISGNISSNRFFKKLARMFKEQFKYWARNCFEIMWIDRNQLDVNISRYTQISLKLRGSVLGPITKRSGSECYTKFNSSESFENRKLNLIGSS